MEDNIKAKLKPNFVEIGKTNWIWWIICWIWKKMNKWLILSGLQSHSKASAPTHLSNLTIFALFSLQVRHVNMIESTSQKYLKRFTLHVYLDSNPVHQHPPQTSVEAFCNKIKMLGISHCLLLHIFLLQLCNPLKLPVMDRFPFGCGWSGEGGGVWLLTEKNDVRKKKEKNVAEREKTRKN